MSDNKQSSNDKIMWVDFGLKMADILKLNWEVNISVAGALDTLHYKPLWNLMSSQ